MSASVVVPSPSAIAVDQLGFFRWGRVAGNILITTDGGDWAFLSEPEFAQLLAGEITAEHPRFAELRTGGFIRDGLDLDALAGEFANEMLSQATRLRLSQATTRIREYYTAAALRAAAAAPSVDDLLAELDAEELGDDPLEISVPWEEKNSEK